MENLWNGQWNTACDDDWGEEEAIVICRQLGYPGHIKAVQGGYFPQGKSNTLFNHPIIVCFKVDLNELKNLLPDSLGGPKSVSVLLGL